MKNCLVLPVLLLSTVLVNGQTPTDQDAQTSTWGMFSSLLKTIAAPVESPSCPGRCFNPIVALGCQNVQDTPGLCSQSGYRCCITSTSKAEAASSPEVLATEKPASTPLNKDLSTWTTKEDTTVTTEDPGLESPQAKTDPKPKVEYFGPHRTVKVCPGVCVATRISHNCDAAIDVKDLCKTGLRCCVAANLFNGVEDPPKEFVVLKAERITDEPTLDTNDLPARSNNQPATTQKPRETPTTTLRTATLASTTRAAESEKTSPAKHPGCRGQCLPSFFAFMCDAVDKEGTCTGSETCCVPQKRPSRPSKRRPKPTPRPTVKPSSTTRPPFGSTSSQNDAIREITTSAAPPTKTTALTTAKSTTTTTTTTETSQPSTRRPHPPCPGTCFPVSISSRCRRPARLVVASGCQEDEICCDDRAGASKQPVPKPNDSMMQPLNTLLSLFGGGAPERRPPPPNRRRPPPLPTSTTTTTTTTTTPEPVDTRAECPGTCVVSILYFTCFANAEITDLFRCDKEKASCCAPKSQIRKLTVLTDTNSISRNDTIPPEGYPAYDQNLAPYDQSFYDQQQYPPQYESPSPTQYYNHPSPDVHYPERPHAQHSSYAVPPPPPPPVSSFEGPSYANTFTTPSPPEPTRGYEQPSEPQQYPSSYGQTQEVEENQQNFAAQETPQDRFRYPPPPSYETRQSVPPSRVVGSVEEVPQYHPNPTSPAETLPERFNLPKNKYLCGVKGTERSSRVVGGEDAVPGEWCWQVALINSLNQYLCGGALIGTQWVLTAAHCVTNIVRSGDAIYVRVGDHDLTTRFGSPGAQTLPVATTYIHHNHNSQTLDNDIALLKLSSEAEMGDGVCIVCLPARGVGQVAGKRCTVTGYGYMGESGPIPLRVREAEIPVVSESECSRKINAVTTKMFLLPASSFCAGGESGHDACQGDGGGPLVCNVDGYYELSGLVSWGFGCGRMDVPGVYVKVSSFIGWINQIISVNNA